MLQRLEKKAAQLSVTGCTLTIGGCARLFQRFLLALADPDAGVTLHALHAATAVLRASDGLRAAAEVDAQQFADTHRQIVSAQGESLPHFIAAARLNTGPDPARRQGSAGSNASKPASSGGSLSLSACNRAIRDCVWAGACWQCASSHGLFRTGSASRWPTTPGCENPNPRGRECCSTPAIFGGTGRRRASSRHCRMPGSAAR